MKRMNRLHSGKGIAAIFALCMALGLNTLGAVPVVHATDLSTTQANTTEDTLSNDPNGILGRNSDIGIKVDQSVIATAGEAISLQFTINSANSKKIKIKDIFPVVDDTFPFETSNDAYKVVRAGDDVEKQKKMSVKYDFVAQTDIKTGYHSVRYIVEYLKDTGEKEEEFYVVKTIKVYFHGVDADEGTGGNGGEQVDDETSPEELDIPTDDTTLGGGSGNTATPKLIITGYDTAPKKVMAGDIFTITIHVQNTSKTTAIRNAKFLIGNESGSILPTSGSSSIYVDRIGAGEIGDLTIEMKTASDLPQKSYVLTVKGDFDDSSNTSFSYSESLYLPIYQEIKLGVTDVSVTPEPIGLGEEGTLMFTINNLGKAGVYNVRVNMEGETVSAEETYVGNIAASSSAYASIAVVGLEDNSDTGIITALITYEDADGTTYEMNQEVNCFVSEMSVSDMGDEYDIEMEESPGLNIFKILGIVVGILIVVAIVVTVIILRKRKLAAQLEEEDDLEDENI
ncbi:MAG: hypothetical protein ACI4F4_06075 [Lachnospiraceae bacterium]